MGVRDADSHGDGVRAQGVQRGAEEPNLLPAQMTDEMATAEARVPQPLANSDTELPTLSVLVPVRNEARCIAHTLGQLLEQDYPREHLEILVIDGESTDDTRGIVTDIAARDDRVKLLHNPRRWSSAARNVGVHESRGELLIVVDGHCELTGRTYLRDLASAFERTGADCLGRPQPQEIPSPSRLQNSIAVARASHLGHHPASYIYSSKEQMVPAHSVAIAYRRNVFKRVGLFDERFDACEDVELNHRADRAGLLCYLIPRLAVGYHPRATWRGLWKQLDRYGRGRMRLFRKHPDTFSILGFAPAGLVAFVMLSIPSIAGGWFRWWFAGPLLAYLALLAFYSIYLAWRRKAWNCLSLLPGVFLTLHLAAGFGILREAVAGIAVRSSGDTEAPHS